MVGAVPNARKRLVVICLSDLLRVKNLTKIFPVTKGVVLRRIAGFVHAVDGVSFKVDRGRTLSLVGESGSGKTTTSRLVARLIEPSGGSIIFDDTDITAIKGDALSGFRRRIGLIFQDPQSSLDPRMDVFQAVSEPMRIHRVGGLVERKQRVLELLEEVGLNTGDVHKYPHQFSAGQRQRIAIARALVLNPDLLILDEPVSALDVSVQAKIVNLLLDLQQKYKLAYLFIAHDLSLVRQISNQVAVMYLGRIVELTDCEDLFTNPLHPYTLSLLASVPVPDPKIMKARPPKVVEGEIPSAINRPSGCHFHTRCPYAQERSKLFEPQLIDVGNGHWVSCHYWDEIQRKVAQWG